MDNPITSKITIKKDLPANKIKLPFPITTSCHKEKYNSQAPITATTSTIHPSMSINSNLKVNSKSETMPFKDSPAT